MTVIVLVGGEKSAQELEGGSNGLRCRLRPVYTRTMGCPTTRKAVQKFTRLSVVLSVILSLCISSRNCRLLTDFSTCHANGRGNAAAIHKIFLGSGVDRKKKRSCLGNRSVTSN